ncbi:hypothetical protein JHK85_014049 [Glycine max]|nr:hypothetical protein JHK85_014049 [Glycine max]
MGICFSIEDQNHLSISDSNAKPKPAGHESGAPLASMNIKDLREGAGYSNVDIFTYEELRLATKHFRPDFILGEGGFGVVYKGVIDHSVRSGYKSTEVAIKELNREGFQGDREWLAEVNYLGQFSHPNLVKLIGYCCEDDHRLLVYEYMASGSLEKHLFRRHLTARSDVYGFGVVLLEMLIGRRALDKSRPSREHNLVEWARPLLNHNKKLLKILDPKLEGQYSSKTALKVAHLAYQCLSQNPKGRPLMSQVVEILENFQSKGENEEDQMLQTGDTSITLYEVPKGSNGTPT